MSFFGLRLPIPSLTTDKNNETRARVSLFLSVVKDGIGNLRPKKLKLSENYRSEKLLVEKFNEVFTKVFPKKTHLLSGAVNYSKSTATKMNDNEGKFELKFTFIVIHFGCSGFRVINST